MTATPMSEHTKILQAPVWNGSLLQIYTDKVTQISQKGHINEYLYYKMTHLCTFAKSHAQTL